ncbi:MAG: SMP-30/gluconolactonase/LRE family protein [Pedobacter sp.]|uniref:SMP-30/gluconolactonase/LRE family protein n=1 Tax=Pedobacter sp. TaxID=1411316 RepID=UPI002807CB3E|nr:SMP-30/gluconolactonase/LRE family protein [Pedobacter sp.]MDQ8005786.1 SMP-30/gluconolactonase/LRE family protein [Pedobacter sp.]
MSIILDDLKFPEGPCFDSIGNIWLVEKDAGNLVFISDNDCKRFNVGGAPNGIAIDENDLVWFCDSKQNSIRTFDPISQTTSTIVNEYKNSALKMPNDLAFDRSGNLLFTCPGDSLEDSTGYICCLSADKKLSKIFEGMYYPNGLVLNQEQTQLFVAETGTQKIWKFEWNTDTKQLSNKTLFAETGGSIGPDGIAFDEDGNLYVAVYGSGKVKVWDKNGVLKEEISSSGNNPTNCALDPSGKKGLIITEAENGILVQLQTKKRGII